jgi:pyruvate dehydrogenase E2 component (dihydrolipoamide acetyltransferase)
VERPSEPNVAPSTTVEEITVPLEPGYIRPGRKAISPRAKKLAEELGLPILPIDGSGAEGRIREADVRAYHEAVKDIEFAPGARELCRERNVDLRVFLRTSERPVTEEMARAAPAITGGKPEPLSNMRAIIADRLSRSKRAIPHFYLTTAVDMSAAVEFRLSQQKKHSFNDLLIKAVGLALREFPRVASVYTPQGYVRRDHMNVGLAVATESGGLVVPVIRDADMLSLDEISTRTRELIDKARKGRTDPSDCAGGAFTVSNLGMYPVDEFVAIINPGEAAILAVGAMIETPVARDGEVQVRPMMKMTLSCDHRVIDGAMAAAFNARIKALLESPAETLAGDGDQ